MYIVSKHSTPGWTAVFEHEGDAFLCMLDHTCTSCLLDYKDEFGTMPADGYDLSWTACGCEFGYDVVLTEPAGYVYNYKDEFAWIPKVL